MGAIITQKQNNKPWTLTWKASGRYPMVADRIYATLADAQAYVDDLTATASATPGLVLSVVNDGKNNGIYYVQSIAQAATETTEFVPGVLVAAGAGAGSEAVANYAAALAAATADNLGQILYVTNPTYKKGEGTTINPDDADVDTEGNKIVIYTEGPYIVTGNGAVAKLGTTSATGDIAGDVENLKGRMSTAEGEIDALQTAVGNAESGLVKGLADANDAIDAVEGRMDTAEGEIDALQTAVGNAESGLVADVAGIKTTIGNAESGLVADIAANAEAIEANTTAVAELRQAVAGGVHFRGVYPSLPVWQSEGEWTAGEYQFTFEDGDQVIFHTGDVIIVEGSDNETDVEEPTKEYILAITDNEEPQWVELGDVSVADQKIADLEKDFDDHVKAMETAWSEHLEEADGKYATITNLQAAEKALEDHVAAMAPTIASAADYTANKSTFALTANVVANDTFNQHVTDASNRMDGIDQTIANLKVKDVDTTGVLSLTEGVVGIDLSNYVTKDGNKVLSTNDFTNELKAKLDGVAAGAQVNVIETIKVNGSAIVAEDKAVNIDLVNHLAGKVSVNGQVLAETDDNGVLAAVVDASDIHLGAAIGDHAAESTTVQSMLSTVYDIANSKIGSIHLAAGTTANVLALSKTNIANDTIELKIAAGSAITATANGLDLVWTEL